MVIEIDNLDSKELEIYKENREIPLLRYFEPEPGLFIAESPNVIERAIQAGYMPKSILTDKSHLGRALELLDQLQEKVNSDAGLEESDAQMIPARQSTSNFQDINPAEGFDAGAIPVYCGSDELVKSMHRFAMSRGMLSLMRRRALPSVEEVCRGATRIAVLENVMNPTNVGAIFRSAAALGIDALLLTASASDPLYRRSVRVSMGTVFQVPWTFFGKYDKAADIARLHDMGFKTAAMALTDKTISIRDEQLHKEEKLAILLGTESEGLAAETIAASDYTIKIPMSHGVDSLNVAAASAIAFWELGNH